MRSFLVALAFLTIIPIRFREMPDVAVVARSRIWYPVVGLLLGMILGGLTALTDWLAAPALSAFLVLLAWVGGTGALHLDGLADTFDGLFGGSTAEERLQIMKDPHVGTFGVAVIVLLILGKYVMLVHILWLLPGSAPYLVGAAVMLARCHVVTLASLGSYPRSEGTGQLIIEATQMWEGRLMLCLTAALVGGLAFYLVGSSTWLLVTLGLWLPVLILVLVLHGLFCHRLGGTTGDCLGAGIELVEAVFLFAGALLSSHVVQRLVFSMRF